jgi:hypothetical protein
MIQATMSKIEVKSKPSPKYLNDQRIEEIYGIPRQKLRKMRLFGRGPEFRRFGYRTVLYDVAKLEQWIASLPRGGA